jgi:galactokinase/mevalonate kinase-like predicted kinase
VRSTMTKIADLAVKGKDAVLRGDEKEFISLMNQNFNLRLGLFGDAVSVVDRRLIELTQSFGPDVGAKLPGSGGAVLVFALRHKEFEEFLARRDDVKFIRLRLRHSN